VIELRVKRAALLAEGQTQSFAVPSKSGHSQAFVLRFAGTFVCFLNECPHWSVELDLGDEHFFDQELGRIYCKNHGALFHPKDGSCETGPCLGRSLTQFKTRIEDEDILVEV
jgi:nitrite reductase/ring-hydroxylating ferredoxin subunit